MPLALRSRFIVGVYDPNIDDSWPYFHLDEGVYLSKSKRLCSFKTALQFETPQAVREFYTSWKSATWPKPLTGIIFVPGDSCLANVLVPVNFALRNGKLRL